MKFARWNRILALGCTLLSSGAIAYGQTAAPEVLRLPTSLRTKADPKDKEKEKDKDKADDKEPAKPVWTPWKPTGQPLTLGQCLALGQERQPAIRAAAASLAASERGYLSLYGLRKIADLLSPDLPIRKRQAQRGLAASGAEVLKARQENTYDVCRLYYTYVYATQQELTAAEILEQIEIFYDTAKEFLKSPIPDPNIKINEFTLGALDGILAEVKDLREEASLGRKKSHYALAEAMGVDGSFEFVVADAELPLMNGRADRENTVSLALANRPELVQAAVVLDVTVLEVCAQIKLDRRQQTQTFASGTDLHSRHIPSPHRNGDYRPGAIAPEMPAQLVGSVADRVARTQEYVRHQGAAYDKAAGLIRLEAINAFLIWESTGDKIKDARERHERAQKLVEKSRSAAATKMDPKLLVENESLASKAQAKYVKAVYEHLLSLIALEKVTGGAVAPSFPGR